jgi:MFS transporter, DHA1 family, multidrug resistance protein
MKSLSVITLGAVVLVGFFDNFSQFPIVAPYARSLGATPGVVGLVVAAYSATNLIGNLLAGHLLDSLGRKRLLVSGLVVAGTAVLLYVLVRNPTELVAVRAFHGLAAAILAPAAFTLLGDLFPGERRGRAMGASGALIALAAMVAPAVSGVLRDRWGFAAVYAVVGALFFATALAAFFYVGETYRPRLEARPAPGRFLVLLRRRALVAAYVAGTALAFGLGTLVTQLPLRLADLGYGGTQTGLAFSSFAFTAMLVMAGPLPRFGGPTRWRAICGWGLSLVGGGLLLLPAPTEIGGIAGAMAVYGLGFGLIFPSANAQVAEATQPSERGTAFGIFYAFYSVGVILGSAAAGAALDADLALSPFHLGVMVAIPSAAYLLLSKER